MGDSSWRSGLLAGLLLPLVGAGLVVQAAPEAAASGPARPYLVALEDSAGPSAVARITGELGDRVTERFDTLGFLTATLKAPAAADLESDSAVAFVTADSPMSMMAARPSVPAGVTRIGAGRPAQPIDDGGRRGGRRAAVAVLDSGIDQDHPDLNVAGGTSCLTPGGFARLLGLVYGFDPATDWSDRNGHGTHVAGTIGAKRNGVGVLGVSPGAPLYAVKVFGALGHGHVSDVVCGLNWVAANAEAKNIKVVNMSFGFPGEDDGSCGAESGDALHAAVCRVVARGVTVVAAAGNAGADFAGLVPAAYDEVLTVTAMADYDGAPGGGGGSSCRRDDTDDAFAEFSNFARTSADAAHTVAAPGVCVLSTWKDDTYRRHWGTSMASPHAAGLVARCIDAGPCAGLTPDQVITKVRAVAAARPEGAGFNGDPDHPVKRRYYGHLVSAGFIR